MPKKTKAIKIPIQLAELVHENEKEIKPIGEVLLDVYKDYLVLKKIAETLPESEVIKNGTVTDIFLAKYENDSKLRSEILKTLDALKGNYDNDSKRRNEINKTFEDMISFMQKIKNSGILD